MKAESLLNCPTSEATRSYTYISSDGTRCVAWRRYDGTFYTTKEPEDLIDPVVGVIRSGSVDVLLEMIMAGRNVRDRSQQQGWNTLHEAAAHGQDKCLRVLLTVHPELIDRCDMKRRTPLFVAVESDQVACVECLLNWGADPNISNKDRETALCKACDVENAEMVKLLLNVGADVNKSCSQGWTPLHEAVCRNNVEICEILLKAGAKICTPNTYGLTPVFVAAQTGNVEALGLLLQYGANIDSQAGDGATALFEACKNGHERAVRLLLLKNADANKQTKAGLLPLHTAAQHGHYEIVSMLIPVTCRTKIHCSGISPLHLAAEHDEDYVLELLIQAGFDVNALLTPGRSCMYQDRRTTALYFSVSNGNIEAAAMLLKAGANPNLDYFRPILVALRQGSVQMVQLLLDYGADVNTVFPNSPTTFPSTVSICMNCLPMLKLLMDNGCDALSCLQCRYGSKSHPPLKNCTKDSFDVNKEEPCIQFCEMISRPTVCHWAGPIIDLLLDYVGNVKLCSRLTEQLDSNKEWLCIKERTRAPHSMKQLCRLSIHHSVGAQRTSRISKLPLPKRLIQYLHHQE
ncbi:ankyrin repeat and SOCS box protein 2-like [Astyanax mexicanus]|uniref:ankyrin repeat and SOCS box protein 2-like n=1 Tax=Astyanax mexicanus TaxID=7994 RepID=UPI0020CAD0E8|nr:ankyrin repeat and SOCS box protein 2-like [Astyanax mexicanus]